MNDNATPLWCEATPRDRANGRRLTFWALGWAATMLFASAAVVNEGLGGRSVALIAASVSAMIGIVTMMAYRRFLNETDELRQKIELEALATAVGVGVVGGLAYSQFTRSLDLGEPRLAVVIAAMLVTHALAVVVGRRRFA